MNLKVLPALASLLLLSATGACTVGADHDANDGVDEDAMDAELTSNTALARTLKFQGRVYVDPTASDYSIVSLVKKQTQSAFGALREANIGVNSRELSNVDSKTFVKRNVTVVDGTTRKPMVEVTYTYTDNAVVPKTMSRRSSISLGLLNGYYQSQSKRILAECTSGDAHAVEFEGSIWYVFDPSLSKCKTAITAEQKAIDTARKVLTDPANEIVKSEAERLYIPMTARLSASATSTKVSYPEYDRLYAGGVQKGKLVIGMVNGMMADWAAGEKHDTIDDDGYKMWFEGLDAIFKARPNFKLTGIEGVGSTISVTVNGKTYSPTITDVINMEVRSTGFPAGITYSDRRALRVAIGDKLAKRWVSFEAPVNVTVSGVASPVTIVLNTYFGAEGDSTPHKRAIKTSDIFVYNGHSYIGYGPLDPSNFRATDFPSSYQILFINGCVSYNYYEKDYVPLKQGGTRNLDLVTNGLESWVNGSGPAMGRFVGALIDGKQNSYTQLLKAAEFTGYGYSWGQDALRVVDGELDNVYSPSSKPIVVSAQ